MNLTVAYRGRSSIVRRPDSLALSLAPNLRRDRVSFDGVLRQPLRFREAVSALHDVVISDLRYQPKDKSAYEAYLKEMKKREEMIRRAAKEFTRDKAMAEFPEARRKEIEEKYRTLHKVYWDARTRYSTFLQEHDPGLFRLVMPLDPVVTVAPDAVFFECFSADESSYACLTVQRDAFANESEVSLGTTNVDYSWALYDHFQELRTYRQTRFTIDPSGFETRTGEPGASATGVREEKIDLPPSWLRGFMQLQSAMSLPMRRVPLGREGLYNVLSYLKRHKARKSPRAVRFELQPGKPTAIVLEPFEQRVTLHDRPYHGARGEVIRVWGRDRLQVLSRLLPLLDDAEVYLLGTGLPSFWVMRMGDMRLILGLSGWTKNDWTGPSALDQLAPPAEPSHELLGDLAAAFKSKPALRFDELRTRTGASPAYVAAGLNRLALFGQVIHDLPGGVYRWRQILPVALSLEQMGPENPETVAGRELLRKQQVDITRDEQTTTGMRALTGNVPERPTEILLDKDNKITRGKCTCSYFYQSGLRRGPCRHMQALRAVALRGGGMPSMEQWFESMSMN
jgi:hypothetical protein